MIESTTSGKLNEATTTMGKSAKKQNQFSYLHAIIPAAVSSIAAFSLYVLFGSYFCSATVVVFGAISSVRMLFTVSDRGDSMDAARRRQASSAPLKLNGKDIFSGRLSTNRGRQVLPEMLRRKSNEERSPRMADMKFASINAR